MTRTLAFACHLFWVALCTSAQATQVIAGCPDLPNLLRADVAVTVTYDEAARLYRYQYRLTNHPKSLQDIRLFALEAQKDHVEAQSRGGWLARRIAGTPYVAWMSAQQDLSSTSRTSLPRTLDQIKPGQSSGPFTILSPIGPGPVHYQVLGWEQTPQSNAETYKKLTERIGAEVASEIWQEAILEQCPKAGEPMLNRGVVGVTVGPTERLSVEVKKFTVTGLLKKDGFDNLYILEGSSQFDVRQIDLASLSFSDSTVQVNQLLSFQDLNRDAHNDIVVSVPVSFSAHGDCTLADIALQGMLMDGRPFMGAMKNTSRQCEPTASKFYVQLQD
jgi:hypothetical protein